MVIKTINHLLRRYLATFLIFNHLLIFCPQAIAISDADARHLHDLFGEETTSHIVRKAKDVNVIKGANLARMGHYRIVHNVDRMIFYLEIFHTSVDVIKDILNN